MCRIGPLRCLSALSPAGYEPVLPKLRDVLLKRGIVILWIASSAVHAVETRRTVEPAPAHTAPAHTTPSHAAPAQKSRSPAPATPQPVTPQPVTPQPVVPVPPAAAQKDDAQRKPEPLVGPPVAPASACQPQLAARHIEFRTANVPPAGNEACRIADPVTLVSIDAAGRRVLLPGHPLISCEMALRFSTYVAEIAVPLAKGIYDQTLAEIATGPGFECRTRNHSAGAKVSSHAQGNALDIAVLVLGDGRKVPVERPDGDKDRQFLSGLRAAGCGSFSTVLGPGSDLFHATHFHFDIEARGRDGMSKFCQ